MIKRSLTQAALAALALVAACASPAPDRPAPQRIPARILPESYALGGGAKAAWLEADGGGSYELRVTGGQGLRALYVEADLPAGLVLRSASFTDALAGGGATLSLALCPQPGKLVAGQVIARPLKHPGLCGDAVVARLRLGSGAPARQASLPPQTPAAQSELHLDLPSATLDWLYLSPGDADQNGEVNIADLTPLGLHFGATGPFADLSALAAVDGDGNGEINIADITPIGSNYGRACGGYKVYMSLNAADAPATPDAPSSLAAIGTAGSPAGDPAVDRLQYGFSVGSVTPSAFYWVRPFDGLPQGAFTEGTPSTLVDVDALEQNLPPVAALEVDALSGPPGLAVHFDASGSTDPDGGVVKWRWDPDGDGAYLFELGDGAPLLTYVYSFPGTYHALVRVYDDLGASSTAAYDITISLGAALTETVDPDLGSLTWPGSMALIDGAPAVAYNAGADDTVRYARATSASASTWTAPRTLDNSVTSTVALAALSGGPAVVWTGSGGLIYRRALDAQGDLWAPAQLIAADVGPLLTGFAPDLAVIGGNPAVSYTDSSGGLSGRSFFKRALDAAGLAWGLEVPVALDSEAGYSGALWEFAGAPCLLYANDVADTKVHFARAADAAGGSFQSPLILDSAADAALNSSALLLCAGRPLAVYWSAAQGALLCCRATDPSGTDWIEPEFICAAESLSNGYTAAVVNGLPVVAFHAPGSGLAYAIGEPGGNAWNPPLTLAPGANLGRVPAVLEVGGRPVFCYLDADAGELRCLHYN